MKKTVITPINHTSEEKVVFATLKEFPTERMIFLTVPEGTVKAEDFSEKLKVLGIQTTIIPVQTTNPWEGFFKTIAEVAQGIPKDKILINISSADRISQCALTNAAQVNGLKTVAVLDNQVMILPILKLSYENILSEKKMKLLEELEKEDCCASLEDLSKRTEMSLQLVSYHINGTLKSEGLVPLELVEKTEEKGRTRVTLTTMGRLLLKGYIKSDS